MPKRAGKDRPLGDLALDQGQVAAATGLEGRVGAAISSSNESGSAWRSASTVSRKAFGLRRFRARRLFSAWQILTQDPILDLADATPLARGINGRALLPGPLVPTSPVPFVGRATELAAVRSLLERAVSGEGGLVLLVGDAGGGKTRLVCELARQEAGEGVLVLYGASDAATTARYEPLLEWFAFLLRVGDREALDALTGDAEPLARLVSQLAAANEEAVTSRGDSAAERYRLQTAVTNLLARMSRVQPLLLVVDDVQWSDPETLHLLRALRGRLRRGGYS